jgi:hypothetical protein
MQAKAHRQHKKAIILISKQHRGLQATPKARKRLTETPMCSKQGKKTPNAKKSPNRFAYCV